MKIEEVQAELMRIKQKKLMLIMDRLHEKGLFNGNVLVAEKGRILLKKSYGMADFRENQPLNGTSAFRIASLSMSFTAMATILLVEEGKLSYDTEIPIYLEDLPYPAIKIRHLLEHTSGLPDYISFFYSNIPELMTYASNQNVISWLRNEKPALLFSPGSEWAYTSTGYVVLAEIIEKVSGMSFADFLEERILKPLGLKNTYPPRPYREQAIDNRVLGFQPDNRQLYDDNFLNNIYGDRGLYSTVDDLYKWDQALYTEKLVSRHHLNKAFSPGKLENGQLFNYGFGWHIREDGKTFYHMGGWLGFKSALMRTPEDRQTIILLTNNVNPVFEDIVKMIYNILNNQPYQMPS